MRSHSVGVKFKDNSQWGLLFKSSEKAQVAFDLVCNSLNSTREAGSFSPQTIIHLNDDYGTQFAVIAGDVTGVLMEDLETVGEAVIERTLIQARTQAKANGRANADPTLKTDAILRGDMHRINGPLRS